MMEKDEILGDFRVIKKIGSGPLGDLLLAEHRFVRKKFALKVLPPELMKDEGFLQRFQEAVVYIARLDHLNIVKVHNISSDGSKYFIVTDYIADDYGVSQNLSTFLASQPERLSENQVLSILKQVAYGLDYIHSRSHQGKAIFHGGLKLNNILIGPAEEKTFHVYLSDCALSSIVGQGWLFSRMLEAVGSALQKDPAESGLGLELKFNAENADPEKKISKLQRSFLQSYAFLAPEQKLGGNRDFISPKSDTYSFGILTYFLIMGYLPEGYFAMPSQVHKNLRYDWDLVIAKTLAQTVNQRPESLVTLLEQATDTVELEETQQAIAKMAPNPAKSKESRFSQNHVKANYGRRQESPKTAEKESYLEKGRQKEELEEEREILKELPPKLAQPTAPKQDVSEFEKKLMGESAYVRVSPMIRGRELEKGVEGSNVAVKEMKPKLNPSEVEQYKYEEDPGAIFQEKSVVKSYRPQKKDTTNIEPMLSEMVVVEGGDYSRGSNIGARDERPRHKVTIHPFAIDIHPVTNEQFLLFLEVMDGEKDASNHDIILLKESRIKRSGGKLIIESGYAKHPVVGVSWYGAVAYAKWVGKRLPTEAEWEIAASGGLEENVYPVGRHIERSHANFFSSDTTPVMSYPPTEHGLYDMAGNVYEWCEDWYEYNYYEVSAQEPSYPVGPKQGVYRVLRGGCWKSLQEDLRCSHRHRNNPGTMNRTYGFRCAADVQDT